MTQTTSEKWEQLWREQDLIIDGFMEAIQERDEFIAAQETAILQRDEFIIKQSRILSVMAFAIAALLVVMMAVI